MGHEKIDHSWDTYYLKQKLHHILVISIESP